MSPTSDLSHVCRYSGTACAAVLPASLRHTATEPLSECRSLMAHAASSIRIKLTHRRDGEAFLLHDFSACAREASLPFSANAKSTGGCVTLVRRRLLCPASSEPPPPCASRRDRQRSTARPSASSSLPPLQLASTSVKAVADRRCFGGAASRSRPPELAETGVRKRSDERSPEQPRCLCSCTAPLAFRPVSTFFSHLPTLSDRGAAPSWPLCLVSVHGTGFLRRRCSVRSAEHSLFPDLVSQPPPRALYAVLFVASP